MEVAWLVSKGLLKRKDEICSTVLNMVEYSPSSLDWGYNAAEPSSYEQFWFERQRSRKSGN
jgi:hypothetical protein